MARMDFGNVLRRLRHDRGETLEQVSEATGLSVAMLSRVERGERLPSPESVEALAEHFSLAVDYLMSETIAHRLVNRYGEESTNRAAEHLSREPVDQDLMAGPTDGADEAAGSHRSDRALPHREPRSYGPFREQDIFAAFGDRHQPPPLADKAPEALSSPSPTPGTGLALDPATEQVLRAAGQASEAATVLVRREMPALSPEARLELVERLTVPAGHAVAVLQTLASDPDRRVRDAAREALKRLTRR